MKVKVEVPGVYPSLNEFINADRIRRGSWSKGNVLKHECQTQIIPHIKAAIKKELKTPISLHYTFFCPNAKKDKDNVASFFTKVFQDSLVVGGVLHNDGWNDIKSYRYDFEIDKDYPRVEVEISEVET